jgi:hypothetical protein
VEPDSYLAFESAAQVIGMEINDRCGLAKRDRLLKALPEMRCNAPDFGTERSSRFRAVARSPITPTDRAVCRLPVSSLIL